MAATEIGIGVIKKTIVSWTNSSGKEFIWGCVGMPVVILETWESTYKIVDIDGAAAPIQAFRGDIEKVEVLWQRLK